LILHNDRESGALQAALAAVVAVASEFSISTRHRLVVHMVQKHRSVSA
jgi:hypothetical protein